MCVCVEIVGQSSDTLLPRGEKKTKKLLYFRRCEARSLLRPLFVLVESILPRLLPIVASLITDRFDLRSPQFFVCRFFVHLELRACIEVPSSQRKDTFTRTRNEQQIHTETRQETKKLLYESYRKLREH